MKIIVRSILISFLLVLGSDVKAELPTNLKAKIEAKRKTNRLVLIHTEEKMFKVYASFKKKKITAYYELDSNGKIIEPVYNSQGLKCTVCITQGSNTVCYEVDCADIPPPKETKDVPNVRDHT